MATVQTDDLYEASFDNITIDSDSDDWVSYPDVGVDVSVPDEPLDPPCPDNDSPIKTFINSKSPTGEPTTFVGSWYTNNRNVATCGSCNDADITMYLRHHLVASTDRKLTKLLKAGKFQALQSPQYKGKYVMQVLGSGDHLGAGPAEIHAGEPERGYRFTYRFKLRFPELAKCEHLTIFYYKAVNTQDLVRDYDLAISPSLQLTGKLLVKTIVDNSKISDTATVYKNSKTGAIWNGKAVREGVTSKNFKHHHKYQVDAQGNGVAIEACSPSGVCHSHRIVAGKVLPAQGATGVHDHKMPDVPILTQANAIDAKIKNVSHLRKAKNITVDLFPRPEDTPVQVTPTHKYLPFFGLSCDPPVTLPDNTTSNIARFYFDINIEEVLRHTDYGGIFDKNLSVCCRDRIIDLSKILSLEVKRRRVGDLERRDVVVTNDLTELVAHSGDAQNGMFEPYDFVTQYREVSVQEQTMDTCNMVTKKIGVLKEIFMEYDMGIRTFTGTDYDFPESGEYEYCVSVKVRNGITLFLNEKLGELMDMRKKIVKWLEFSSHQDHVDKTTNVFKKRYKDIVNCDPQGGVDLDQGDNPYLTIPDNAIVLLSEVLGCVTNYEHIGKIPMVRALYASTNAETGNLNGIRILIELYDILITELKKTLGNKTIRVKGGEIVNNAVDYQYGITHGSKAYKDVVEFQKCFRDINCPCVNEGTWFDFLGVDINNFEGMKQISPGDYAKRTLAENEKYFGKSGTAVAAGSSTLELLALINGGTSGETLSTMSSMVSNGGFSSYLTPSRVQIGRKKYDLSKLQQDSSYYNKIYNLSQQGASANLYQKTALSNQTPPPNFDGVLDDGDGVVDSDNDNWDDDSSTVDTGVILGEDDHQINVGLAEESDNNGCKALWGDYDITAQEMLNNMFSGCPQPCGDEIRFVHQGLDGPGPKDAPNPGSPGITITGTPTKDGGRDTKSAVALYSTSNPHTTPGMPPQLLSLLGAPTTELQLKTVPELQSMLMFNYDIMVIVEALAYISTPAGMVKTWIPMTQNIAAGASISPVLVRMRKYSERKWGMRECPDFNVSICDSYFILGDPSIKTEYCQDPDTTVKNYLIEQQKVYRNAPVGSVNDKQKVRVDLKRTTRLL